MTQMVLPQTPPEGPRSDSGVKPASGGREKNGDSHFDSVSRAEQQRLDNKQAQKQDQARSDQKARDEQVRQEKDSARRPDDRKEASAGSESRKSDGRGKGEADKPSVTEDVAKEANETAVPDGVLTNGEMPTEDPTTWETDTPLTFAGLQALMMPADGETAMLAGGKAGGQPATNGALPGVQAFAAMIAGMPGSGEAKPGQGAGQGTGQGAGTGMALTEALMSSLGTDAARTQEPPTVQGAMRFQAAAELASQQVANPNTAKLPADAAALRGYTTSIDVPVNHAEWGDKLVGKLTWLTARNMSVAEIHLTPPDMGPMEVRVQVQQEQANITVHSANAAVRDQLELHSHRLRDMLSEQGLSLEQFDVSDSSQQQTGEDGSGENTANSGDSLAGLDDEGQEVQPQSLDLTWKGEVDVFA